AGDGDAALGLLRDGGFVILDVATTPELEAEGRARDVVRAVQEARKSSGLEVGDRIRLTLTIDAAGAAAAEAHRELIARETLATSLDLAELDDATASSILPLAGGTKLVIGVEKA
ncbi:DUF5915 domain-containing protein, partial [Agromyces tardus]